MGSLYNSRHLFKIAKSYTFFVGLADKLKTKQLALSNESPARP